MVVVVIIGVLVAIAIPVYNSVTQTAAERAHDANARTLKGAASVWYAENSATATFPATLIDGDGDPQNDFEDYIDGELPTIPDALTGGGGDYEVSVSATGQVTVIPDVGTY
ncbi:hypothetical protein OMD50_09205 [Dethiobacter alkaliphilus]|nr:hypothetical protein [Dethiobacter alkaliphilus]MCW3490301.1 hypothetical protein [Dethiobacter alkaliphilus]